MENYRLADFAQMLGGIIACSRDLRVADEMSREPNFPSYFYAVGKALEGLRITCANFNADASLLCQMDSVSKKLMEGSGDQRPVVLHAELEMIVKGIQENLERCKFMFMPSETASYWENFSIFGKDFILVFPEGAIREMIEAGNCYAARRATACVFHCMRTAEYGLRMLAEIVGAEITDRGQPCPIEYGVWQKVIDAIRTKIKEARTLADGPEKQGALNFYAGMADHCEYMKDMWRNEVSHARRLYSPSEALAAIQRVKDFSEPLTKHQLPEAMRLLAARNKAT
ncbi:MAG TPA: hypothetical protein VHU44_13610 [Acidobacteriaceae bacterium]|jgi:hypothetical protein|nr:hypothetical protein [Acidobacteriaceae bacterium]